MSPHPPRPAPRIVPSKAATSAIVFVFPPSTPSTYCIRSLLTTVTSVQVDTACVRRPSHRKSLLPQAERRPTGDFPFHFYLLYTSHSTHPQHPNPVIPLHPSPPPP